MTLLANSILQTLAFFDAKDLALSLLELRSYLPAQTGPTEISLTVLMRTLEVELSGLVGLQGGFYFLTGRNILPASRRQRYKISLRRFRKAKKYLRFLRFLPYLRAVALSGSQAMLNSTASSDIDLFLITKKNRIWLTRLLVSLYFQLLGQRRYRDYIKNRFCLNHYLGEGVSIRQDQNLYTAVEYASLLPVLGEEVLSKFWEQNRWLAEFLAEPQPQRHSPFFDFHFSFWQKTFEWLLELTFLGPALNWLSGMYQKQRIKLQDYIIVSEDELSFHPGSRGQRVLTQFAQNLRALGLEPVRNPPSASGGGRQSRP